MAKKATKKKATKKKATKKKATKKKATKKKAKAKKKTAKKKTAKKKTASTGWQRYEYSDKKSSKFWAVRVSGSSLSTHWGRIDAEGQQKVKELADPDAAREAAERLIAQKTKKGYSLVGVKKANKKKAAKKTAKAFSGFDLEGFWEASRHARESYVEEPATAQSVRKVEKELGFRLPASYIQLMKTQNGGIPRNTCFPTKQPTSWAEDHVAISGISGIGWSKTYSLCGDLGSKFMQQEWGYPTWGVCVCNCPSAGHDMIMLDYRKCGPDGEPEVVHVEQEGGFEVTFLASDFEMFIRGLVNESVYDTP